MFTMNYVLKLTLSLTVLGLVSALKNTTVRPTYTGHVVQADSVNQEIEDAVISVFDTELSNLVRESCIASTEALIATVKDSVLSSLTSLPLPTFAVCCPKEKNRAEYFDALGTGKREWRLAFRGTPYINKSIFDAYRDGTGVPTNNERGCKQINTSLPCSNHYRNNDVLNKWENIEEVAFVVYKDGERVHHIVFDAEGTSYMDWFTQARVKTSSWGDLKTTTFNSFDIAGLAQPNYVRRFFINHVYNGCPGDAGWFVASDRIDGACPWEQGLRFPIIRFATGDTWENWTTGDVGNADLLAVFVKYYADI